VRRQCGCGDGSCEEEEEKGGGKLHVGDVGLNLDFDDFESEVALRQMCFLVIYLHHEHVLKRRPL
jgi:hypothetical protein